MAEGIEKLTDLAEKWGNAAVEAIGKHGPDAVRLAETVARIDAIRSIVTAFILVSICGALIIFLSRTMRRHYAAVKAREGSTFDFFDCEPGLMIPSGIIVGFAALIGGIALTGLLDPMAWAGAFEPKIWIAAKILKL